MVVRVGGGRIGSWGAVVEMMRAAGMGCPLHGYTGAKATGSSVPRAELEVAEGCRDGEALKRELGYLQLSGKAAGENDDMAMGLALVCWKTRVRWRMRRRWMRPALSWGRRGLAGNKKS